MNTEIEALRNALSKAVQTTANQPASMGITFREDIAWKTFQYAPFLTFLESKGRCSDVNTANVAFYKEAPTNTAAFINESEDIPEYSATAYDEVPDRMKTVVSGIKVSKMAEMGTDYMDVLEREIERGYMKVNNIIDTTLLGGAGTAAAKDFKTVCPLTGDDKVNTAQAGGSEAGPITEDAIDDMLNVIINENGGHPDCIVTDSFVAKQLRAIVAPYRRYNDKLDIGLGAGPITEDAIDDMLNVIINENGGHPDCIVTDSFVAKQLRAIVAPYRRYNDKLDIGLGHKVVSYESLDGTEVPIIIDQNIPYTQTGDKHNMFFIDTTTIDVKYLMRPSLVTDLPGNNLAFNQAVASFVTAMNVAPFKNGAITDITAE